jgi:hypothetical protein
MNRIFLRDTKSRLYRIFLGIDGLTEILILDFHKDWQRRVRVHFDQVRIRNPYPSELHRRADGWSLQTAQLRTERTRISLSVHRLTFGYHSLAASTAVVRPVSLRPPLLLLVRLTSCVPLCAALPSSTTAVSVSAVVSPLLS